MSAPDRLARVLGNHRNGIVLGVLLASVGIVMCFSWPRETPESLFQRALAANRTKDQLALLQQTIAAAEGNHPAAEIQRCLVFARMKEWDEVGTLFARLNKQACPPSKLLVLAKLGLDDKQWKTAEAVLIAHPEETASAEERLRLLSTLYRATDRIEPLIDTVEKLTRVAPNNPQYWWVLAQIHEQLKNTTALIRVYEAALTHNLPKDDEIQMRHKLLEHRIEVGDTLQAREQLDAWRAEGERGPRMDFYEAYIFELEGHPSRALDLLEAVLRELGEIPEALRLRGVLHFELGHYQQSVTDFKRVTELNPGDEVAHFKVAEAYRRLAQAEVDQKYTQLAKESQERYLEIRNKQLEMKIKRPAY